MQSNQFYWLQFSISISVGKHVQECVAIKCIRLIFASHRLPHRICIFSNYIFSRHFNTWFNYVFGRCLCVGVKKSPGLLSSLDFLKNKFTYFFSMAIAGVHFQRRLVRNWPTCRGFSRISFTFHIILCSTKRFGPFLFAMAITNAIYFPFQHTHRQTPAAGRYGNAEKSNVERYLSA